MMDNDFERFDLVVERYLNRQMSKEEELAFKKELDACSEELKQRAATIALVVKAMHEVGGERDNEIIAQISNMSEEEFRKATKIKSHRLYLRYVKYAIAACFIGVVLLSGYEFTLYNSTVKLGKENYYAYTFYVDGQNRGVSSEICDVLTTLFANVEEGKDLKSTISQLEDLYELSVDEDSDYNEYEDDIAWNLAMAHLKKGHKKRAIPYLQDIVNRNQQYPEIAHVAQEIIDKIEN